MFFFLISYLFWKSFNFILQTKIEILLKTVLNMGIFPDTTNIILLQLFLCFLVVIIRCLGDHTKFRKSRSNMWIINLYIRLVYSVSISDGKYSKVIKFECQNETLPLELNKEPAYFPLTIDKGQFCPKHHAQLGT